MPKSLYPDLWEKLEATVADRRLTLSRTYPGPWPLPVRPEGRSAGPITLSLDHPAARERFDAVLDWEVGLTGRGLEEISDLDPDEDSYWHWFSSGGKTLRGYDLDLFFGRLPERASVLVRIRFHRSLGPTDPRVNGPALADAVRAVWRETISNNLRHGKLKGVLAAPATLAQALRLPPRREALKISWSNFRGPGTPHEEVLYSANGRYVGRGDAGFAGILAEIGKLPERSEVILPCYQYGGRAAFENFTEEEREAKNDEMREIVPFAARRPEFDAAIARRMIKVTLSDVWPGEKNGTVMDWESGDRYGQSFVAFGRIVRHDKRRGPAAARLGWAGYALGDRTGGRQVESEALYTIDDVKVGRGVAGFANAMEKLATLPAGSVVQVNACIRTKGPFSCPLTYEGHRHFERTGFEPYVGMFPWLIDVARTHQLEIQWIPDEQKSYGDCQMAR